MTNVLRSVKLFNASASTAPATLSSEQINITLSGAATTPNVIFNVADSTQGSNVRSISVPLPVASGANRIEFDLGQGASAQFRYWVTAAATVTTDAAPTGTVTGINNSGWSGVTQASMGLFNASTGYRANYGPTNIVRFDEFDSRRTSFIGL